MNLMKPPEGGGGSDIPDCDEKPMIKFSMLASGSNGNACYVETRQARILIDAGLSALEIQRRLAQIGVACSSLDALVITHEHSDHIRGAGPLARRYGLPVYLNRGTFKSGSRWLGGLPRMREMRTGCPLRITDLNIETFTKCHDAADPVGMILSLDGIKIGMVTDLGRSTRMIEDRLKGCQGLILEFNHDLNMLEEGPYPRFLKQRIKSRDGHLSNEQAGDLLGAVCHADLKQVVLAHLSEKNNRPEKACESAYNVLKKKGLDRTEITVSRQHECGPIIELI